MAIRLIQPGRLSDVLEGLRLTVENASALNVTKDDLSRTLGELRSGGLVCLYAEQRYELTDKGNAALERAKIKDEVDIRRIFLLKASRRDSSSLRSDTWYGSLQQ